MLRNREFMLHVMVLTVFVCAATVIAYVILGWNSGVLVLMCSAIMMLISIGFTMQRYYQISKLSGYLRNIANGAYSLDVRDNREGELSILKNEIYKVTLKLSEQTALLKDDKLRLTEAISDISHQLKTPLTSMQVMNELLEQPDLPEHKRKEFSRKVRGQIDRLDWLITSLLKLSKIDAGTTIFKQERIQVSHLLQKALAPIQISIELKDIQVSMEGKQEVSFIGDLNWTAEAVINILKNAIEHSGHAGNILVTFAENPLYTELVIHDNGKGIDKEDLPFVFKRFYRGKHASDSSIGIGLAMAHSIIVRQNGTIDVQSVEGKGTSFCIKWFKAVV